MKPLGELSWCAVGPLQGFCSWQILNPIELDGLPLRPGELGHCLSDLLEKFGLAGISLTCRCTRHIGACKMIQVTYMDNPLPTSARQLL